MPLPLDVVTEISRAVAAELNPAIEVLGVASTDGGTNRVEILVTIAGCHQEPCRLVLNLSRVGEAEFEQQLRTKLREALVTHAAEA